MMKFLSLKNGQTDGRTDMLVDIANRGPVLCELRKSCGQLKPKLPILGPF